jgi:uncharacterized protein (DUF1499 family)
MTFPLLACAIATLGLALLGVTGPAYRVGVLSLPNALTLFRWAAYTGLVATLAGLLAGSLAYRRGARVATFVGAMAVLGGVAGFGIPFAWQRDARSVPPIHDITTDLERPPTFDAIVPLRADAPNSLERPSELSEQQRLGYPDLAPVTLSMPPHQAFDRALAVAQQANWDIVTADKDAGRIEATDTTRWFGFHDDVVVRLTPWGAGTRVDVRSVSRVGGSDVGTNARRIRQYLTALQAG